MNCQQFEEIVHHLAHHELRDAALADEATDHTVSCAACAALLAEAKTVAASLAALSAEDAHLECSPRIENELRAALYPRATNAPRAALLPPRWRWGYIAAGLGLAAAIIVAALFLPRIMNRKQEINDAKTIPVQSSSPAVASQTATPVNATPKTPAVAGVTHKRLPATHPAAKHNAVAAEETLTGFVMLPYADDPSTIHSASIVRVSIPRSSLGWFGFPVVSSNPKDRVVADFLMNQGGTPEAIRLVQ
jgi:hypothetical protein